MDQSYDYEEDFSEENEEEEISNKQMTRGDIPRLIAEKIVQLQDRSGLSASVSESLLIMNKYNVMRCLEVNWQEKKLDGHVYPICYWCEDVKDLETIEECD